VLDRAATSPTADDTVVVFTSDHGDMLGAHGGMAQKWHQAYEESTHVPFIVHNPRLFAGRQSVDTLITIPNDRLISLATKKASFLEMLKKADDVLLYAVKGISDLITIPGLINLDFADVRTIMAEMGVALMGTGLASGENRALEAAQKAISSPLLEDITIAGARAVLMNITASSSLGFEEVTEASALIQKEVHEEANIIWGTAIDESMGD